MDEDDKVKELIYLNCKSYEFFQEQLDSAEKDFFVLLEDLLDTIGSFTNVMMEPEVYIGDEIFLNKLKNFRNAGEKYIAVSIKFEKEMQEMERLAPNLRDSEIEFTGVDNRFLFISDYIDELEQALILQSKMRESIEKQLRLFKSFEKYE
tara:strand:- start:597 stop:1046 length:450 start_codon:yes stop_codon:yes gene_type:complete